MRTGIVFETAKQAVITGNFEGLEHTGLMSVQLIAPDDGTTEGEDSDET